MSITVLRLAASANPDRPYQLTHERSVALLAEQERQQTAKLATKQQKWQQKLQERLSVSEEDAAVLLQITQHTRGSDEFPLHGKDKQQMMKLARQLSAELGYSSGDKGKKKESTPTRSSSNKLVVESDHTSVTEPETERSEDDVAMAKAVVVVKKEKTATSAKKNKKIKGKTKPKKAVAAKESVELDAIDSLDDKIVKMEQKIENMRKEMATLVEFNQRMASDLTEVLKRV